MSDDRQDAPPEAARWDDMRGEELLLRLAAAAEMLRADSPYYTDVRLIDWLAGELRDEEAGSAERSEARIHAAAESMRSKVLAEQNGIGIIAGRAPRRVLEIAGTVPQLFDQAPRARVAPDVELPAAAGAGRSIWDEVCHHAVLLPPNLPRGRYLAIRIKGDSMEPLFREGSTRLVRVGAPVRRDTVVLAQLPDDGGYVVKRVARVGRTHLRLASLNPAYAPITVPRDERTVVGRVVLVWTGEA